MFAPLALALLAFQAPPAPPPAAEARASAYLDAGARDLVAKARGYRDRVDRSITRYQTRALERVSMGVTALRRERLMYRREIATRIDWQRDGVPVVEVEGAREVIPVAFREIRLPEDMRDDVTDHAFDPAANRFMLGFSDDSAFVMHPLGQDAELHYRFRSGDTTRIRLQDGRTLVLATLEIIPTIEDVHHLRGTIWIDTDSHAMVRGVFTLADEFRMGRDLDDDDDVPGFLDVIRADVRFLTVEYGLWDLRWWLPRVIAFEGTASLGSLVHFPLRYEMRYDAYTVEGDTTVAPISRADLPELDPDSVAEACYARGYCRCTGERCRNFRVIIPDDTAALMASSRLPASVYAEGEVVMSPVDVQALDEALRTALPGTPWQVAAPTFAWGLGGGGLVRYNRIEALSLGARAGVDLGKLQIEGEARLGVADLEPNVELRVLRPGLNIDLAAAAYRRLDVMNPSNRPLGFGNSFNALFLGRDDGEYFRALGAELIATPRDAANRSWELRVFAERQRSAEVETDFSVPHLFDGDRAFRANRAADDADQAGADLALRYDRGLNPGALRWGTEVLLRGSTGTFDFVRGSLTSHVIFPIGPSVTGSLEAAGGWSGGTVPVQSLWYLGGPGTLRGYDGATAGGEAFWRGRAELGYGFPGARLALFGDAGWAGTRDAFESDPSLIGVGVGGSFMDGLLRVDLARALRGPTGWRLDLYLDGLL